MQEELQNHQAVVREITFEVADIFKTLLPEIFCFELGWEFLAGEKTFVDTHDEGFFVVTTIEDADASALRQALCATPQKIVVQLFGRRGFERRDLAALWIHA